MLIVSEEKSESLSGAEDLYAKHEKYRQAFLFSNITVRI